MCVPRATTATPNALTLASPAKLNLHLRVGTPDASGFHPLRSWMVTTAFHDTIRFERIDDGSAGGVTLTCDDATLACDETNLVVRAARALLAAPPLPGEPARPSPRIAVHLTKRIPAGAGLGGGSGNAGTTLVALDRLLDLRHGDVGLRALAATLGSDVPFFLGPPSAIATGRGEQLAATPAPAAARFALLILPPFGVPTAAAYRTLDALRPTAAVDALDPFDAAGWSRLPAVELLGHLVNDLEPAAFALEPRLAALHDASEKILGRTVCMSGSGSTLFTLYDDPSEAATGDRTLTAAMAFTTVRREVTRIGEAVLTDGRSRCSQAGEG